MSEARTRQPRWDPDERGIGIGDARAYLGWLDALRAAADQDGWVAEEPEAHLLPHIRRHVDDGAPWVIDATATGRGTIRAAAHCLIGVVAEGIAAVAEVRGPGSLAFEVVTGMLSGQTEFGPHGHTLRLRIDGPPESRQTPGVDA